MKKWVALLTLVVALNWALVALVLAGSSHQGHGDASASHSATMEHGTTGDMFSHKETDQGVRAEFQIMSLASMNMKDPEGNTHHIMVKFFNDGMNHQIKEVIGKIKGVRKVEAEGNRLHVSTDSDLRAAISKVVVDSGVALIQMKVEEFSLDDIYKKYFQEEG